MSPQQVERHLGKPTTKRGRCWLYSELGGRYLATQGVVESMVAECFFSGRLSDTSEHHYVRRSGKLVPWHTPPPKLP